MMDKEGDKFLGYRATRSTGATSDKNSTRHEETTKGKNEKTRTTIKQPWLRDIVKKQLEQISREKLSGPTTKSADKDVQLVCPFCSTTFDNEDERTKHMTFCVKIYNRMTRSFNCKFPNCGATFLSVEQRDKHHETHPLRDRYFKKDSEKLRRIRGFNKMHNECKQCFRMFPTREILVEHKLSEHGSDVTAEFCPVCNQIFMSKNELITHVRTAHNGDAMTNGCRVLDSENTYGQVKCEPNSDIKQPEVNSDGIFEIKPVEDEHEASENFNDQQDHLEAKVHAELEANVTVGLDRKENAEPETGLVVESQRHLSESSALSEMNGSVVVEQMSEHLAGQQVPIVIEPQLNSFETCPVHHPCGMNVPDESCNAIHEDPVYGSIPVTVGVSSADPGAPNEPHTPADNSNQVWPKYTSRVNGKCNQTPKVSSEKVNMKGLLTYCGYDIKLCSVKLKRLKLTKKMIDQLYYYRKKLKQEKYVKVRKTKKSRTLYECSSSEDEESDRSLHLKYKEQGKTRNNSSTEREVRYKSDTSKKSDHSGIQIEPTGSNSVTHDTDISDTLSGGNLPEQLDKMSDCSNIEGDGLKSITRTVFKTHAGHDNSRGEDVTNVPSPSDQLLCEFEDYLLD